MDDTEDIDHEENSDSFSLDNILNGRINASFDGSMSVGEKPV